MKTATFQSRLLKALRDRANLKQADVAYELRRRHGIRADQAQVARWEAGTHTPHGATIPALADVLGCEISDFYGADEDDEEPETDVLLSRAARVLADHGEYDLAAVLQRRAVESVVSPAEVPVA